MSDANMSQGTEHHVGVAEQPSAPRAPGAGAPPGVERYV